jgi:deoxycitidine kinase/deoxyguanosine kinase
MLYESGVIHPIQYQIYKAWFDEFLTKNEYQFIYLRTSPEVALERVNRRSRKGETIPLAYLQECHRYHDMWLYDALTFQADVAEKETTRWISILQEKFNL